MGRDEKIRVCHIIAGDLWAGAEVQTYTMLKTLNRNPQLDMMAIVFNEGKLADMLREAGVNVKVIDESRNGFFAILRKVKEYLHGRNVNIIHSHRRKGNVLGGLLKRSGHVAYAVQTIHGAPEPFKGFKWAKEKIHATLDAFITNRYCDHILPVSDDLKFRLSGGLKRGRLTTIHNSIDLDSIVPTRSIADMRRELGMDVDKPLIGSAGRMVPVKGFDVFLHAAKAILDKNPETSFVLAGDGPLSAELAELVGTLGIENHVKFPGFRDDIADFLNCLDILVISSHHEGIPTAALEVMALKRPVVSTAVGGMREIIEPNVSGILVESGDAGAIAKACEKLLGDSALREKMGEAARKTIENKFSSTNQAKGVFNIYWQLAGSPQELNR